MATVAMRKGFSGNFRGQGVPTVAMHRHFGNQETTTPKRPNRLSPELPFVHAGGASLSKCLGPSRAIENEDRLGYNHTFYMPQGVRIRQRMKTISAIIILSAYLQGYEYDRNEDRLDYNHTICIPLGIRIR